MPLLKLWFRSNYREAFDGNDIKGIDVYAQRTNEKIGTISEILVDEQGNFRYFVVDLGLDFGKKVLLPLGRARVDHNAARVYAVGWQNSKQKTYLNSQRAPRLITLMKSRCAAYIALKIQHLLLGQVLASGASNPLTTAIHTITSKIHLCTIWMLRIIKPQTLPRAAGCKR